MHKVCEIGMCRQRHMGNVKCQATAGGLRVYLRRFLQSQQQCTLYEIQISVALPEGVELCNLHGAHEACRRLSPSESAPHHSCRERNMIARIAGQRGKDS
jgi:hypothetical protein